MAEFPRLVGALSLYCGERDLAEELAQETLVRVCASWPSVRRKDSPTAWAQRVAINLANSQFRRRAVARRVAVRTSGDESTPSDDTSTRLAVRTAVSALPRRQREALVLRYFADMSVHDAAAVMRCPEATVKTLTRRAIEQLRVSELLRDDEPDDVVDVEEVRDAD